MAGTESDGLYRSTDKGHTFEPVADAPQQINALAVNESGWTLSDPTSIWTSPDGLAWTQIANSAPALVLMAANGAILAGGEHGVDVLQR